MEVKKFSNKPKVRFTSKVVLLGVLTLLLLIPLEMVKNVIRERSRTRKAAIESIEAQWSKSQVVGGPVLNIPYFQYELEDQEKTKIYHTMHILPEELEILTEISPEVRYRGIYKTAVYLADVKLTGHFSQSAFPQLQDTHMLWDDAYLSLGVSENRGFKSDVKIRINTVGYNPEPGIPNHDVFKTGIHTQIGTLSKEDMAFEISFQLSGSETLQVLPLGKTTKVKFQSDWKDPNFTGDYLPRERNISDDGFTAQWMITHLNRNYPQYWVGSKQNVRNSAFGVELYLPVDHYQKSQRSAKYGLLFILLTFLVFIFTEMTTKTRIPFFHYLLVSIALVMFFSLLTALSEQLGFSLAYLIAALATVGLITAFTKSFSHTLKISLRVLMVLSLLYSFMFVLLQMKQYAFLAGNIGLFIILSAVMWFASKIKAPEADEEIVVEDELWSGTEEADRGGQ